MPSTANPAGRCRATERHVRASRAGPSIAGGSRRIRMPDDPWPQLTVEPTCAVVITCHTPRNAGADAVLALAERVVALFRGRTLGRLRFDAPSVDLDGRDPNGFRAIVTVPIRRDAGCPPRPAGDAACTAGR